MPVFKASFDGVMDRLDELERENHRLKAENAAMHAILEAVANTGSHRLSCSFDCHINERWPHRSVHSAGCLVTQARAFLGWRE